MRFGKTFAAYELAKRMGFKKILILTFKPAVQSAWRDDLSQHKDFDGWQFISRPLEPHKPNINDQYQAADKNHPIVCFGSFQDFLGIDKASGGIKSKNEWVHTILWDLVIFDEYHFGAWKDNAKKLFESEDEDEIESEDIFDFSLNRALMQIADYGCRLNIDTAVSPEQKVKEFISYLPVLAYDGNVMRPIDAEDILDYAMSGTSATLLARRWESPLLVNVDDDTLKRLMANQKALDALMSIESFRNLNKDLEAIISKSEKVKKEKKEAKEKTAKEKRELTDSVYIGESETVQDRLIQHLRDYNAEKEKFYWTTAVIFLGRDLNKALIRYLEDRFVQIARECKRYTVLTKNTYSRTVMKEAHVAAMEEFIDNVRVLINALGYKVLEPTVQKISDSTEVDEKLYLNTGAVRAVGVVTSEGFVLFAGSKINEKASEKSLNKGAIALRKKHFDAGRVKDLTTTEDILFSSSSAAADFVTGYSVSGPASWKNAAGQTLKEIESK